MEEYTKTCAEHKPEAVADLYEEISALRQARDKALSERDRALAELATEREALARVRKLAAEDSTDLQAKLTTARARVAELERLADDAPCTCTRVDGIGNQYHDEKNDKCFINRITSVKRSKRDAALAGGEVANPRVDRAGESCSASNELFDSELSTGGETDD